ncbi:uncharacterized protein LOC124924236 [Impatiens glandulifera]|uniref:uncharacterized protein LOC124924236 n=1 Tax=Impatiens glandulifera TaxID=253017 RepID=UPI001FB099C1|nr:uncharacterized protein LOC124924236 [Impatiens glandulifera]
METPTSTRRITRSQTKAAAAAVATVIPDHDHPIKNLSSGSSKYSRKDRSVLFDISNDSPVLGLAMGSMKKKSVRKCNHRRFKEIRTPGSGEALLRDQVKILLKKVEEDQPQLLGGGHFLGFNGGAGAGGGLTPANTPLAFFIKPCQDGSLKKDTPVQQRSIRKNLFL